MKKLLTVVLALMLAVGVVGCGGGGGNNNNNNNDDVFRFAVLSDLHVQGGISPNFMLEHLEPAYEELAEADLDLIVLSGDIVDYADDANFILYKQYENRYFPEDDPDRPEFLYVMGNHEVFKNNSYAAGEYEPCKTLFEKYFGDRNAVKEVEGYTFIAMSTDGYGENCLYTQDSVDRVRAAIEASIEKDPDKPVFVSVHVPPPETVFDGVGSNEMLAGIADDYPQAVFLTGHTHRPISDERSIWQDGYTVIQSCTNAYISLQNINGLVAQQGDRGATYPLGYQDYGFGFICELNKTTNALTIHRREFTLEEAAAPDWVISSWKKEDFTYTEEARLANAVKPTFKSTNVSVDPIRVGGDKLNATLIFRAAEVTGGDCVAMYKFVVSDGTDSATYYVYTDYWKGVNEMSTTAECYLRDLSASKTYDVKIYAVTSLGVESEQYLSASISAE